MSRRNHTARASVSMSTPTARKAPQAARPADSIAQEEQTKSSPEESIERIREALRAEPGLEKFLSQVKPLPQPAIETDHGLLAGLIHIAQTIAIAAHELDYVVRGEFNIENQHDLETSLDYLHQAADWVSLAAGQLMHGYRERPGE